jgi:hypothetical protein
MALAMLHARGLSLILSTKRAVFVGPSNIGISDILKRLGILIYNIVIANWQCKIRISFNPQLGFLRGINVSPVINLRSLETDKDT